MMRGHLIIFKQNKTTGWKMKRYSIAPSSARRKSTYNPAVFSDDTINERENATLELQQLEQSITSTLQDIDKNLSKSNAILNDKIFPIIRQYSQSTEDVWKNVNFWKYFFELSANAELTSYQSPVSQAINDEKNNILLQDNVNQGNTSTDNKPLDAAGRLEGHTNFKKPLLRGNIEELTPTWSTEQPNKNMIASTPQHQQQQQGAKSQKFIQYGNSESLNLNPPPILSVNLSDDSKSPAKDTTENAVFTIRKSLDQYHRLSVSPKKASRRPKTPMRSNEEFHRRSSMIKGFRDSSPTLPEPPILLSEIGPNPSSDLYDSSNKGKAPAGDLASDDNIFDDNELQRFPRTPQFTRGTSGRLSGGIVMSGGLKRTSIVKTPKEIRQDFKEDDSDIQPPTITQFSQLKDDVETKEVEDTHHYNHSKEQIGVPLPELETIDLLKHDQNRKKRKFESKLIDSKLDDDSPFIEDKSGHHISHDGNTGHTGHNSVASTVYHSVMTHQQQNKDTSMGSRDNTKSNSISNLFEDVLQNLNKEHPEFKNQQDDTRKSNDPNSSKEMGSILNERFNQILHK